MKKNALLHLCLLLSFLTGCHKFLAKKADDGLTSPSTFADYQAMLDNDIVTVKSTPGLNPVGSDDVMLNAAALQATMQPFIGIYSWDANFYQGATDNSWFNPYQAIYQCNLVLNGLEGVPHKDSTQLAIYHVIRASALFDRSFHFLNLEETYGQPWRPATAAVDEGIPLRLDADATKQSSRSTVKQVFAQIVGDLKEAVSYLPPAVQTEVPNRPCRPAVWALLARAALLQQDYQAAEDDADSCLKLHARLLDFDTVKGSPTHPFYAVGNPEVLFQCSAYAYPVLYSPMTTVNGDLYSSYDVTDLRRTLYFEPTATGQGVYFKGYYAPGHFVFSGYATDEVYLIRAECRARLQDEAGALADLNTLLGHRYKSGTYVPYTIANAGNVLLLVLNERRKETPFRELRWSDLRRLNQDPRLAVTLKRVVGDSVRVLSPNSAGYTWQIPLSEIGSSHIAQNPMQ